MNADRRPSRINAARRWLVADGADKAKLLCIAAILVPLLVWIAVNVVPALIPEPPARPLDTPGWKLVQQLNEALANEPGFESTCFGVKTENPLRLELVGAVASREDLEDLKDFAARIRPEKDFDVSIELLYEITNTQPSPDGEQPADNG